MENLNLFKIKKVYSYLFLIGLCSVFLITVHGQAWNFQQKVVQKDRGIGQDYFGQFVALNEDYALISSWANDLDANGQNNIDAAGAVYLYQKSEAGVWTFLKKIVASDRTLYDGFGYGVAVDGNYAVIGAPFEGAGFYESAGAFYVFENKNGVFKEKQKLFAPDREYLDEFGWEIAISGDWIIVGSDRDSEDENGENTILGAGSAYLYHRIGNDWVFTQKILASDRGEVGDSFGRAVAISGDYAAIAATRNKDSGAVYIFKNGGGGGMDGGTTIARN